MTRFRLARVFWIGAAAVLVAAALVALFAVLRGDFSETDGRILGTLAAVLLAGSTAIAGLALADRGVRALGWAAAASSIPALAALVYAIWDFVFDGGGDAWRWGWAGALSLIAALVWVTARLLARDRWVVRLANAAGMLAAVAAAMSTWAIWSDDPGEAVGRTIAALWILTGLGYLLTPVLQRLLSAREQDTVERLLAVLDGVELVATPLPARDGGGAARPGRATRLASAPLSGQQPRPG